MCEPRGLYTLLGGPWTSAGWAPGPCLWLREPGDPGLPRASHVPRLTPDSLQLPRREAGEAKESWDGERGLSDPRPAALVSVLAPALGGETAVEPGPCPHLRGQVTHNCKTEIGTKSFTFGPSPVAKAPCNWTVPTGEGTGWIST